MSGWSTTIIGKISHHSKAFQAPKKAHALITTLQSELHRCSCSNLGPHIEQSPFLERMREGLDSKEIKPVSHNGNQSWIFIERTDTEAGVPILWPPDVKSRLTGNDPDAGKDWGQGQNGTTEDEMVGWHHQFNGHEFAQTPRDSEGQGSMVCCSSWGCKELDTT